MMLIKRSELPQNCRQVFLPLTCNWCERSSISSPRVQKVIKIIGTCKPKFSDNQVISGLERSCSICENLESLCPMWTYCSHCFPRVCPTSVCPSVSQVSILKQNASQWQRTKGPFFWPSFRLLSLQMSRQELKIKSQDRMISQLARQLRSALDGRSHDEHQIRKMTFQLNQMQTHMKKVLGIVIGG